MYRSRNQYFPKYLVPSFLQKHHSDPQGTNRVTETQMQVDDLKGIMVRNIGELLMGFSLWRKQPIFDIKLQENNWTRCPFIWFRKTLCVRGLSLLFPFLHGFLQQKNSPKCFTDLFFPTKLTNDSKYKNSRNILVKVKATLK